MRRPLHLLSSLLLLCFACRAGELSEVTLGGLPGASGAAAAADEPDAGNGDSSAGIAPAGKNAHAAHVLTQVPAAPMATLAAKVPAPLHAQFEHIEATAMAYNLQPQLLVAVAMQESTGGTDVKAYDNGGGMFQFTDTETWKRYGSKDPNDRMNDALSVTAAAFYLADEINGNDGDLAKALRAYNGPISNKGLPEYPQQVMAKMNGSF